ncbi:hypothetical protein GCM10027180_14320 [Microbulbifer echini]
MHSQNKNQYYIKLYFNHGLPVNHIDIPKKKQTELAKKASFDDIPDFAFNPKDDWVEVFQKGLKQIDFNDKCIYEVGVGIGTNLFFLLDNFHPHSIYFSDIDARLTHRAYKNLSFTHSEKLPICKPIHGDIDLIETKLSDNENHSLDYIIACIPQVFNDKIDKQPPDFNAHFYRKHSLKKSPYHKLGLDLNYSLLKLAKKKSPKAEVILNLNCRFGVTPLLQLFIDSGYMPNLLYQARVKQCMTTGLDFFVEAEKQGLNCEFYNNPHARTPISAHEAEKSIKYGPIYHSVAVIRGKPN